MEENIIEQPNLEPEIQNVQEKEISETQEGSILGRFKDVKTLTDAYTSLQAEFTRKCQKLADFQREKDENAIFYKEKSLDEVLKDEQDKDKYKKEVAEILSLNKDFDNLPQKNLIAFKIVKGIEKELTSKLADQEFIDKYINENDNLKNKIISDYLSNLNNISSSPKIINGNSNSVFFAPNKNPKSLKEAGEIFSRMLN